MARIYIDARNVTDTPSGIARYARALIPAVIDQSDGDEFVVIRHRSARRPIVDDPPEFVHEVAVDRRIDGAKNFAVGHRTIDAVIAEHGPPDLFHSLFHVVPAKLKRVIDHAPLVVTLHDFVWLDHPDVSQPGWLKARSIEAFARLAIPQTLKMADRVIAISKPTRRRALDFIDDEKMEVISHGVDEAFFEPVDPPAGEFEQLADPDRGCIAAIGNHKDYKNLRLLIDAFDQLTEEGIDAQLALIGDCERLAPAIGATDAAEWITVAGLVGDEVLRRVLGAAQVFVFPSKVEGFGLPILEAMAMGVPTIVSDLEPMRSVAGEAALLCDPDDATGLARLLERIITDDELAARLSERGRRRARQFRWASTAENTVRLYQKALKP